MAAWVPMIDFVPFAKPISERLLNVAPLKMAIDALEQKIRIDFQCGANSDRKSGSGRLWDTR